MSSTLRNRSLHLRKRRLMWKLNGKPECRYMYAPLLCFSTPWNACFLPCRLRLLDKRQNLTRLVLYPAFTLSAFKLHERFIQEMEGMRVEMADIRFAAKQASDERVRASCVCFSPCARRHCVVVCVCVRAICSMQRFQRQSRKCTA